MTFHIEAETSSGRVFVGKSKDGDKRDFFDAVVAALQSPTSRSTDVIDLELENGDLVLIPVNTVASLAFVEDKPF